MSKLLSIPIGWRRTLFNFAVFLACFLEVTLAYPATAKWLQCGNISTLALFMKFSREIIQTAIQDSPANTLHKFLIVM
jgi:hypothetical protein